MAKKSCAYAMAMCLVAVNFAQAATLEGRDGLQINQGAGYVAANGSNLKVGDTVRAGAKSAGFLVYPDGCRVKVAPGSVSSVRANSPCSFKAADLTYKAPYVAPAPVCCDPPLWLVGAAVAGVGLGIAGIFLPKHGGHGLPTILHLSP
jgi:hypothetical protein